MLSQWSLKKTTVESLSRDVKHGVFVCLDIAVVWFSLWLALCIRLGDFNRANPLGDAQPLYLLATLSALIAFSYIGVYKALLRHMDVHYFVTLFKGAGCMVVVMMSCYYLLKIAVVFPRTVPILFSLLTLVIMAAYRYLSRSWLLGLNTINRLTRKKHRSTLSRNVPALIYGAGAAGVQLMEALRSGDEYDPVALLDDDEALHGRTVSGCRIFKSDSLTEVLERYDCCDVFLALPSLPRHKLAGIVAGIEKPGLRIQSIPSLKVLAGGKFTINDVRDIRVEDVLGRDEVPAIDSLLEESVKDKVVMVTGAAGSIGSELCRQLLALKPRRLIMFDHSEYGLYETGEVMNALSVKLDSRGLVVSVLGTITDARQLVDVMTTHQVETVYHAAAYKHVPIIENNVFEAFRNNVLGTLCCAQAAIIANVQRFILISSDKAVRPANIMGASKRVAEMVLQAVSSLNLITLYSVKMPAHFGSRDDVFDTTVVNRTSFTMVRFGNVLGSSGSVVPLFRTQICAGGPLTVTHPDMHRYFMTIREAVELVIQAGGMDNSGEVFVLDMGAPVNITTLAQQMVRLSGLTLKDADYPEGDIEIVHTGLRPGEKLYEELLIGDQVSPTRHPKIFRANETVMSWSEVTALLDRMFVAYEEKDIVQLKALFMSATHCALPESDKLPNPSL
ncbi:polysaccharide biosynthesis protein [Kistimonas asteriae]|uniref:polysaccharide biosynthesis protein n=1 Tax=Kistimonas asteriae TaxID=517724 RepID=UPI001BA57473|nr:nucleoside-diphosphate sugar epimerase/dehydratase [Kistimonas asteriae]